MNALLLFFQILVISLFFGALALLIGLITNNESSATVATNIIYFVLGLLGGNFIPIPLMPKSIQDISAFTPNHWAIKGILTNMAGLDGGLLQIALFFLIGGSLITMFCAKRLGRSIQKGGALYE